MTTTTRLRRKSGISKDDGGNITKTPIKKIKSNFTPSKSRTINTRSRKTQKINGGDHIEESGLFGDANDLIGYENVDKNNGEAFNCDDVTKGKHIAALSEMHNSHPKTKVDLNNLNTEDDSSDEDDDQEIDVFGNVDILDRNFSLVDSLNTSLPTNKSKWNVDLHDTLKVITKNDRKNGISTRLDTKCTDDAKSVAELERHIVAKMVDGEYKSQITKDYEKSKAKTQGELERFHDIKTPELTEDVKNDLKVLQMRNYLDPKRFYKANDNKLRKGIPNKDFQIGTVKEGLGEFFSHRMSRAERKQTFVDQILSDNTIRSYTRRVFGEIQKQKQNTIKYKRKELRRKKKLKLKKKRKRNV